MYKHLLVPLDETELSITTADKAAELAHALKAKITYLYAAPDYSATQEGPLLMQLVPDEYQEKAIGSTNAILDKAGVVAAALGLDHRLLSIVADRPYEAILKTAQEQGCDLIFMASHGQKGIRGMLRGSQTAKVLQSSSIPVLVSCVASNDPASVMNRAIAAIQDEHRSLAVVLHGLQHMSDALQTDKASLDVDLARRIAHYMRALPCQHHHPKEEQFLFGALQKRTAEHAQCIKELEEHHREEPKLVDALEQSLDRYITSKRENASDFSQAVKNLSDAAVKHMTVEETVILPAARKHLTKEDWSRLAAAFSVNHDSLSSDGSNSEYFDALFTKIANLLPRPR